MKVAIVGSSGAGLPLSIFLKRARKDFAIDVFDKNSKIGRKLYATGNGRCNLLNMNTKESDFNHALYMASVLEKYPFGELQHRLAELGLILTNEGDLVYPLTKSAASYVSFMSKKAMESGINFHLDTKVLGYHGHKPYVLETDKGNFEYDILIFATGGKSQAKLGSDGSLFPIFEKHGYKIEELKPSLCPIKTFEATKKLQGIRHEAKVTVFAMGVQIFEEVGEVLFKDDGLSGIVIFNASAYINRLGNPDVRIYLDLFPKVDLMTLVKDLQDAYRKSPDYFLDAYLVPELAEFVTKQAKVDLKNDSPKSLCYKLAKTMKGLAFTFKESYGFESSQVSQGGVSLSMVNENLESLIEKDVYFAGEMLDIDGVCGGYNLTWCLISAAIIASSLEK